jgi:mannose-6-phosphate isomerase-like protein (cupin superfamily)
VETELRAAMHVPPDEGRSLHLSGDTYTFKALGEDTVGSLVLLEARVPPLGGPPPHIHHAEDEFFWLLEGELEFLTNGRTFTANAGSFVYVPKGTTHCFKNVGTQTTRMLAAFTPAGIEGMFFEVGRPATEGSSPAPPDQEEIEKLLAAAPRYNVEILPPAQR